MRVKKLTVLSMLGALAYLVMLVGRFPVMLFLKYDPKDVVITISGFLYGPLSAFSVSAVVSLLEMFTVSETGPVGLLMNITATCAFACTASVIYTKKRTLAGAAAGLAAGLLLMTGVMLLWNYLITPLYMGVPRKEVAAMLIPAFLPFNLLKGSLNGAITLLVYKPLRKALQHTGLTAASETSKGGFNWGLTLVSLFVIATCVLIILMYNGKI